MSKTILWNRAAKAIIAWCGEHKMRLTKTPRHLFPRAFVVGKAASRCLIIARPWPDAEPHLREEVRLHPLDCTNTFDASLKAGDWCTCAYVCHDEMGETVAIPVVP